MEYKCLDCSEFFYLSFAESLINWPIKCIKCKSVNVNYMYCGIISETEAIRNLPVIENANI